MKLFYTERAKTDLEISFEWYEKQKQGLGFEFLDSIEAALKNIRSFPEMYQICYLNFRRCLLGRFPFSIFYTVEGKDIVIHSVFDNRQNPESRPQPL